MIVHKTWYSILVALLGLLFIFSSVAVLVSPETMIPSLLSGFNIDTNDLEAFNLAFLGNHVRNIVIGAFLIYFAFKNTKVLVILLIMRFLIELLDLIGGLIWNPAISSLFPVFLFMLAIELFLIIKGFSFLRNGTEQ